MNDIEYLQRIGMTDRFFVRFEGLDKSRVRRIFAKDLKVLPFVAYSDDTQLSIRVYKSLQGAKTANGIDSVAALLNFKRELRYWVLSFPPHLGKATAVSCFKNLLGFKHTGYASAGNGALMRIGVIARFFEEKDLAVPERVALIQKLCIENTVTTHRNYEACVINLWHVLLCVSFKNTHLYHTSSTIVAHLNKLFTLLQSWVVSCQQLFYDNNITPGLKSVSDIIAYSQTIDAITKGDPIEVFGQKNAQFYSKQSISGYCVDTSAFATLKFLQSCLKYSENHQIDFLTESKNLASLGGDTDTVAVVYAHMFFNAYPKYTCLCDKVSSSMRANSDYYGELSINFLTTNGFFFNMAHTLKLVPKNVWLLFKMVAIRLNDILRN